MILFLWFFSCFAIADNKRPILDAKTVGAGIVDIGEKVAHRVDRVIHKQAFELDGDPWTFQGIPIIFPSPSSGMNLGLKVQLQNIRRQDPHQAEYEAQILASDKGRYKDSLKVDFPHAFGDRFRLFARIAYDRDIGFKYYGMSNDTHPDPVLNERDDDLYKTLRSVPSFRASLMRYLGSNFRAGPIMGLKWSKIGYPANSLLAQQNPVGIAGGRTHYVGLAIIHDTLDFEPYPSSGHVHELYLYLYNKIVGSEYDFSRTTYTYQRYFLLHPELIFAHRTMLEFFTGRPPFFELTGVGGSNSTLGFGKDRYFRGYDSDRFVDLFRFVMGFELRWDPVHFGFAKQGLTLGFVPFLDMGRVWHRVFPLELDRFHVSGGLGARLIWNHRFVMRADFAVTQEGTDVILNLNHSF